MEYAKIPPHLMQSGPERPWKDDSRADYVIVAGGVVCYGAHALGFHTVGFFLDGLVVWGVVWWAFNLIRSCAHRLKHIEELLARRS